MKFRVLVIKKISYIQPPESVFLFLILYFMLDGLVLFHKGGFHRVKCLKYDIFKGGFFGGVRHF